MDELERAFTQETANLPTFMLKNLPRARLNWFVERHVCAFEAYISGGKGQLKQRITLWDNVFEWLNLTENMYADISEAKAYLEAICESTCPSYTADMEKKFECIWKALPSFAQKELKLKYSGSLTAF